jgi:glyoxylase I family protein
MRGAIHHLDLTVLDPERSRPFYEAVLGFIGYHLAGPDGVVGSIGIVRAQGEGRLATHNRRAPGLHHLALGAESREDVDRFYQFLLGLGATILDPPAHYPEYGAGYYAVFFADPDGLKLEFVFWPRP